MNQRYDYPDVNDKAFRKRTLKPLRVGLGKRNLEVGWNFDATPIHPTVIGLGAAALDRGSQHLSTALDNRIAKPGTTQIHPLQKVAQCFAGAVQVH